MIRLIEPCSCYLESYIEAYDEYEKNDINTYWFSDARSTDIFEKFENYKLEKHLKPNRVGADYYWFVDEDKNYFIGEIVIRHQLTDDLKRYGGHIGYGIRYNEWNKGYGTKMLQLSLEKVETFNFGEILITCDDDNIASYKVMEKNGFILKDKVINLIDGNEILTRRYIKVNG